MRRFTRSESTSLVYQAKKLKKDERRERKCRFVSKTTRRFLSAKYLRTASHATLEER
jgi:hypothetical protein